MTLSQTAVLTKRIITITFFALVLGIISFIGYKLWYAYYLAHLPPIEEKPDTKYGLLPALDFPKSTVSSSNFTYSIDTSTGNLPKIGDPSFEKFIKVYFVTRTFATLLASEKSQILAEKFDITQPPEIITETNYHFQDKGHNLKVDLDSGNFVYTNQASPSARTSLDDNNKLVSNFENILNTLGIFREEFKKGRTKVVFLKDNGGTLIPTSLRADAVAAQVSIWPPPIDRRSIFTGEFNKSLIYAVVSPSADNIDNYRLLNFTYFPIDTTTFATYPIKTPDVAFEDLKLGKGVVVITPEKPNVSITSIYLGYYLADNYNPYLQPIFVFEGPNFAAYVSAVSEQFQSQAK